MGRHMGWPKVDVVYLPGTPSPLVFRESLGRPGAHCLARLAAEC